jgi:hypothetical protein
LFFSAETMDFRDDQFDAPASRPNPGRKLVDCLAELQSAEPLSPDALATGGSVQDVLARAAIHVPFASEIQRRQRRVRRTIAALSLAGLAGIGAAAAWFLPGMLTPPAERTGLTTVVSAAEKDLSEAVRTLQSVRFTQVLPATPAPRRTRPGTDLTQSADLLLGLPLTQSVAPAGTPADPHADLPVTSVTAGMPGQTVGGTPLASPVDEPPLEVPH